MCKYFRFQAFLRLFAAVMTYPEALEYLFTKLPMYQRIGAAAYKKDLSNTLALLKALGDPHKKFTSIHIAGTNGKGSVTNMLSSICMEAGYRVGWYTSPHLEDFRERIKVNGHMCHEQFVVDFVQRMEPHIEANQPSFFELTVAMAFEYFALQEVEIAVVEVGLGGRLDSTNVITPILSVITNISFDHMQMLGNTLQEIAGEKAGIIKNHVPVVIGEYLPETLPVFEEKALEMQSPIFPAEENVAIEVLSQMPGKLEVNVTYLGQLIYPELICGLSGEYQIRNLRTVIQSTEVLMAKGIELPEEALYEGLRKVIDNTGFAGRWQWLQNHPTLIADCAHNSGGLAALFSQVNTLTYENLHIVTGSVNDKDLDASLSLYPTSAIYYFAKPDIPRGLEAETLQNKAFGFGLKGSVFDSVRDSLYAALNKAGKNDLVLICGSIFVVAEALPAYRDREKALSK